MNVPAGLSLTGFESWAGGPSRRRSSATSPTTGRSRRIVPCGPNGPNGGPAAVRSSTDPRAPAPAPTHARRSSEPQAVQIAKQDYSDYTTIFLYPSDSLMIKTGLWIELEATIGFIVGLGLGSLLGQRTVAVILMIVLEIILTPIFSTSTASPI